MDSWLAQTSSWFLALFALEAVVHGASKLFCKNKLVGVETNDAITSISAGQCSVLVSLVKSGFDWLSVYLLMQFRTFHTFIVAALLSTAFYLLAVICSSHELALLRGAYRSIKAAWYVWILNTVHDRWRLVDLPWDSPVTWLLCFIAVDLVYYLFHRATHEVGVLWAVHQTHHSSEYYNLSTALRQSALQNVAGVLWDTPKALLFPVPAILVHKALNTVYQFWLHTELVPYLGPLEYVINTPSAHRVHHGRNPYCIDKNYGGTLIIWDRIFGTYEPERREEKVVYGLVEPVKCFDQLWLQLFYFKSILWEKPSGMKRWCDKVRAVFYPPGWVPGTPLRFFCHWFRLVDTEAGIPQINADDVKPYNPPMTALEKIVAWWQNVVMLLVFIAVDKQFPVASTWFWLHVVWQLAGMQTAGALFDRKPWCHVGELARNAIAFVYVLLAYRPLGAGARNFLVASAVSIIVSACQEAAFKPKAKSA